MGGDERRLTHLDAHGRAAMVDISDKPVTVREAIAGALVVMQAQTLRQIVSGETRKGDVFAAARIAGIMAAKRTSELIPLCHPLPVSAVAVSLTADADGAGRRGGAVDGEAAIRIEATVRTTGRTGVEMEALTAASVAALTIYDMCKAVDRGMRIESLRVIRKSGGASGLFEATADP